jgi:hypothetical protein
MFMLKKSCVKNLEKVQEVNGPLAPGAILKKMLKELIFHEFFYNMSFVCINLDHINTSGES